MVSFCRCRAVLAYSCGSARVLGRVGAPISSKFGNMACRRSLHWSSQSAAFKSPSGVQSSATPILCTAPNSSRWDYPKRSHISIAQMGLRTLLLPLFVPEAPVPKFIWQRNASGVSVRGVLPLPTAALSHASAGYGQSCSGIVPESCFCSVCSQCLCHTVYHVGRSTFIYTCSTTAHRWLGHSHLDTQS